MWVEDEQCVLVFELYVVKFFVDDFVGVVQSDDLGVELMLEVEVFEVVVDEL